MENLETLHQNMVANQLLPSNIHNKPLVEALQTVPRHFFVPERFNYIAYADKHIALNSNRSLIAPATLARMIQATNVNKDNNVLDIACGSGYSTALFARIAKTAVGIESENSLSSKANSTLNKLKIDNVIIINGELAAGHPESAPYDIIFINGAINHIPQSLRDQLSSDGCIVAAIADTPHLHRVVRFTKEGNALKGETIFETVLPLLPELKL